MDTLSVEQRDGLQKQAKMIRALRAIDAVVVHETRIAHEVALAAPSAALETIAAVVEGCMGAPRKAAGERVAREIADSPMVVAFGGLRTGQTLYVTALGASLNAYVAFWPWGSGKRLTIKIGVHGGAG